MFEVKLLTDTAKMPTRGSEQAAGLDLYADSKSVVCTDETSSVGTGIAVRIPEGFVGLVKPRSGLAFTYGIDSMAGVIDSDYRGEIRVLLTSHNNYTGHIIEIGDRIAQLLILPVMMLTPIKVDELDETERGTNGFGSSGI